VAIGDAAAAQNLPVVPGTGLITDGDDNINAAMDAVAREMVARANAVQAETTARINRDAYLEQAIVNTDARVTAEANARAYVDGLLDGYAAQLFNRMAAAEAAINTKQPLHGYTPVAQTNNNAQLGLRFDGRYIICRINDAYDVVLGEI
jgi:hypothetical protein